MVTMLCCDSWYCVYICDVWRMVVGINLPRVDLFLIVIARERLERPRDKTRARASLFIPAKRSGKREEKREIYNPFILQPRALSRGKYQPSTSCAFILVGFTIRGAPSLHACLVGVQSILSSHLVCVIRRSRRCIIDFSTSIDPTKRRSSFVPHTSPPVPYASLNRVNFMDVSS